MNFSLEILGNLTKIRTGKLDANAATANGIYPFFTCAQEPLFINRYAYDCDAILVAGNGDLNVKHYKGKFEAYQRTYIIEVDQAKLDSRYLYYFLSKYVEKLRELSIGGVIKYIKLGMLTDAEIPLPPLSDQKRIATILDKADAIRRKRQAAIKLADDFLRATFLDMFGDPVTDPKKWKTMLLGPALLSIDGGWSVKSLDRPRKDNEWGVLKISSVTSGRFNPDENKAISEIDNKKNILTPQKGDLLFSRANTRELVAATCIVEKDEPKLFLPDKLWKIETNRQYLLPEYLKFLLSHRKFRQTVTANATGTSGSMLNISKEKLRAVEIPLPAVGFQKKFADIVWNTYELERKQNNIIAWSCDLFNALTQRAFRGEL